MAAQNFPQTNAQNEEEDTSHLLVGAAMGFANRVATGMAMRSRGTGSSLSYSNRSYSMQKIKPGMGSTASYYRSYMKAHPRANIVRKAGSPQFYNVIDTVRIASVNYGQQAFTDISYGLSDDLNNMVTQVTGYGVTTDIFLQRIQNELTFTNQAETTTYVDIYEVTPRYAVNVSPATAVTNGLIDQSGATGNFNNFGSTPLQSRQFTQLYKVHKKYTFELAQGQSHSHKSTYVMNQKWNQELYNVYGSGYYMRNFAKCQIVVARGVPINDQTTKTYISAAKVGIDVISKQSYYWFYNNPTNSLYKFTNNQGTITTGYVLDVGSGEAETIDIA